MVRMEEIGLAFLQQMMRRRMAGQGNIVPPHMRYFNRGIGLFDPADLALDPAKTRRCAMFQPARRQQLHPHANAQKWRSANFDPLGHCGGQSVNRG